MKKLVFATNNQHKLEEVRAVLADKLEIVSLNELGCFDDIPETADTLEGNALIKAQYIYEKFGLDCFADDTGLEVDALGGEPGVYSARYAGEDSNARNNMHKLLKNLGENSNRTAHFRTVIALIEGEEIRYFEGKINGEIAYEPRGDAGFGYDPIFIPEGYDISFAEIGANVKNTISHRALAVGKLTEYLKQCK
jgi:XTP/dITP diphosphohydrolase